MRHLAGVAGGDSSQIDHNLRRNVTVDWSVRDNVRAELRGQVKLILKRYKYPPDMETRAIELVLKQAEALSDSLV